MLASVLTDPFLTEFKTVSVESRFWEELQVCPICERAEYLRDIAIIEGESLATVTSVCVDCEHGFLRRRPSKEWFNNFYSREWDQVGQSKVKRNNKAVRPDNKVLQFCSPPLLPRSNVLEVGAGFGKFLLAFKEQGHQVQGIERSEHRAKYVQDVLGISCIYSSIESVKFPHTFELTYLNHVFEHVSDPAEAIDRLSVVAADGGLVYFAVPDFWQEFPPLAYHFVPHLSLFTAKSLGRLLTKKGFRIIKMMVSKEIQLLAVKEKSAEEAFDDSTSASRSDFWNRTSQFVCRAFGGKVGKHTLVWSKSNTGTDYYQNWIFPGTPLVQRSIKLGISAQHVLPRRVRNSVLPNFITGRKLSMLRVNLTGDISLPVNIKYQKHIAPIWIK